MKISVIIPTYNGEKTIKDTLDSVLSQVDIFGVEIIVADDCSTDNTLEIVKKYRKVKILTWKKNSGGPNKGRNLGIKESTGDYICMLDQDDIWTEHKLREQIELTKYAPIIFCGWEVYNSLNGKKSIVGNNDGSIKVYRQNKTYLNWIAKDSRDAKTPYMSTIMFHKKFKDIKFEELYGMVDFDWVAKLVENQKTVKVCSPLVCRIIHENNLSLSKKYRVSDHYYNLLFLKQISKYPFHAKMGMKRLEWTYAKHLYLSGEMKKARKHLRQSNLTLRSLVLYIISFARSKTIINYLRQKLRA